MGFLKDWEYFYDVDKNGKLKKNMESQMLSARSVFANTVLRKSREPVSFEVSARAGNDWDLTKETEAKVQEKIREMEQSIWKQCVAKVLAGKRNYIGDFPSRTYHLYTLANKEGKTYSVDLDCRKLIEEHTANGFAELWEKKETLIQPERERRNLRIAAVLAFVHLLLNLAMTLSCLPEYAFLYPAKVNPTLWGLMVAGVMLAALIFHGSKSLQPLFGLIMVLFTFGIQSAGPTMQGMVGELLDQYADKIGESKTMMVFGVFLLIPSLVYCVLYTVRACKARVDPSSWQNWISRFDAAAEDIHRELCFLMLWYKDMTGQTCKILKEQEKALFECAACADKHRRK